MMTQTDQGTLKGWHVLLWLTGFFGLMFAVNGVFLFHAIVSFPGEDTPKSYVQGINYNDIIEARSTQAALDWRVQMGLVDDDLVVKLADADGAPIRGRSVSVSLRRPATINADQTLTLEPWSPGEHRATPVSLQAGQWEAEAIIFDPGLNEIEFRARKILFVP
ncbi:MAG: FixH family protein [Pseudomonadota bacterium]